MPENTMSGSRLELPKILQTLTDHTIPYLARSTGYKNMETVLRGNDEISSHDFKQLLEVCAHDLKQDMKYASSILTIVSISLERLKLCDFQVSSELLATALAIVNVLNAIAPLHKVYSLQNFCLEVLCFYPEQTLIALGTGHMAEVINLIDQYLSLNIDFPVKLRLIDMIIKLLEILPKEDRRKFVEDGMSVWFSRVIPLMFQYPQENRKALEAVELLNVDLTTMDYVHNKHWNALFKNIAAADKYPAILKEMLENGDPFWHRVWSCIVKLLGTQLHKSGSPINTLLLVLEHAFKMSSVNRCRAFRCWKVLIENFSLNITELFVSKRIKLLSIPLKVNNAKMEDIALAKFDVWWYLIRLLKPKIEMHSNIILIPFLHFCFGTPKSSKEKNEVTPLIPGLAFPKVTTLTAQAFVEIIGHADCTGCVEKDFPKMEGGGLINSKLLADHVNHWMYSLKQCIKVLCSLANSGLHDDRAIISVKCIWRSLLKLNTTLVGDVKQEVFSEMMKILKELSQEVEGFETLSKTICCVLIPDLLDEQSEVKTLLMNDYNDTSSLVHVKEICNIILSPTFQKYYYCSKGNIMLDKVKPLISIAMDSPKNSANNFLKWFLQELDAKPMNDNTLMLWSCLAESFVDENCDVTQESATCLLIWPIKKIEYFSKVQHAASVWLKVYKYIRPILPSDCTIDAGLINILMLHYTNTPVAKVFMLNILPIAMSLLLENNPSKVHYLEKEVAFLVEISESNIFTESDQFIKECSNTLSILLDKLSLNINTIIAEYALAAASNILKVLVNPKTAENNDCQSLILSLLKPVQKIFLNDAYLKLKSIIVDQLTQCVVIVHMPAVRSIARSIIQDVLAKSNESEVVLNTLLKKALLDNDKIDSATNNQTTPKGSSKTCDSVEMNKIEILRNDVFSSPKSASNFLKKAKSNSKVMSKVVEGKEEFVVVKTNWKFNPEKLTDHQKEVMRKRRENIPALYQDLSQSQDEFYMKLWKMPGYKSDSSDTSSASTSFSKDANEILNNILKDIPNSDVCPKMIKTVFLDNNGSNLSEKEKSSKIGGEKNMKENKKSGNGDQPNSEPGSPLEGRCNISERRNTPTRSPRISLKDRISQNVKNLIAKGVDGAGDKDPITVNNEEVIHSPLQNSETQNKSPECRKNIALAFPISAPPKLDVERPSRMKRKPKKFEPTCQVVTRRRNSLSPSSLKLVQENKDKPNKLSNKYKESLNNVGKQSGNATNIAQTSEIGPNKEQAIVDTVMVSEKSLIPPNLPRGNALEVSDNIIDPEVIHTNIEETRENEIFINKQTNASIAAPKSNVNVKEHLSSKDPLKVSKLNVVSDMVQSNSIETRRKKLATSEEANLNATTPKENSRKKNIQTKESNLDASNGTFASEIVDKNKTETSEKELLDTLIDVNTTPPKDSACKRGVEKSKLSSNKKSRLESQLAIDTVEGHPLLTPKQDRRATRKSQIKSRSPLYTNSVPKNKLSKRHNKSSPDSGLNKTKDSTSPNSSLQNTKNGLIPKTKDSIANSSADKNNSTEIKDTDATGLVLGDKSSSMSSSNTQDSEDFIESSQESTVSSISVKTAKRSLHKNIPRNADTPGNRISILSTETEMDKEANVRKDEEKKSKSLSPANLKLRTLNQDSCVNAALKNTRGDSSNVNNITAEMDTEPINTTDVILIDDNDDGSTCNTTVTNNTQDGFTYINSQAIADGNMEPMEKSKCSTQSIVIAEADTEPMDTLSRVSDTQLLADADTEPVDDAIMLIDEVQKSVDNTIQKVQSPKHYFIDLSEQDTDLEGTADIVNTSSTNVTNGVDLNSSANNGLSSPFKDDVQRNKDFLNNTLDISPIKVTSPVSLRYEENDSPPTLENSNDFVVITLSSPVRSNGEPIDKLCNSPEIFTNDRISPDKRDQSPPRGTAANDNYSPSSSLSLKKNRPQVRQTGRAAQMLGLCVPDKMQDIMNSEKQQEYEDIRKSTPVLIPARRNLRMLYNSTAGDTDNNPDESESNLNTFLKFTKELPSASSSPSCPILKRKLADIADDTTLSPASKRKRVSFHDPPVSTTMSVHKYIESAGTRSPQSSHIKNKDRPSKLGSPKSLVKKLENEYKLYSALTKTMDSFSEPLEAEGTSNDTEMSSLEETPTIEVIRHSDLNDVDAIYPRLMKCKEPIGTIAAQLSSSGMKDLMVNELKGQVDTIGDLAILTELEVNRLCIKAPKIEVVMRVLADYEAKFLSKTNNGSNYDANTEAYEANKQYSASKENPSLNNALNTETCDLDNDQLNDETTEDLIQRCRCKTSDSLPKGSNQESMRKAIANMPISDIVELLRSRLSEHDDSGPILEALALKQPQDLLSATMKHIHTDEICNKLGLDIIHSYLIKNLSQGNLVKFCSILLQEKIPSE